MTLISIRERGVYHTGPVIEIDGQQHPIPNAIRAPFGEQEEAQLEWYFEQHLRFPFTNQVKAATAAASIATYGQALFKQVLGDNADAYADYRAATRAGLATLTFEIAGSPTFQSLHWEALWDPKLPQPFALQSTFIRRNLQPQVMRARVRESPTINVLVVTARPGLGRDVGYRTISRPLVAALRQAGTPVQVDMLRPGSYAALAAHLAAVQDSQGAGYYHVIHFDVHGALLPFADFDALEQKLTTSRYTFQPQRYGRARLAPYAGVKAFLFLESGAPEVADPVEATELANLLLTHQIPIAILNACQSAKYKLSDPSPDNPVTLNSELVTAETSLGSQLMSAGMQMVLAMGYSVTVSAAEIMMGRLYQQLFQSGDLAAAIRSARLELHNRKERRAYFNQTIALEDWLLPVVYQNQPQRLTTRPFTAAEQAAYDERRITRYPEPHITYGFVGRDLDILHIEQRLLRAADGRDQNLLLVRGMGGAGKSTLLRYLGYWWQTTGFIQQVFYFGYDKQAYTLHQILDALGRRLWGEQTYIQELHPKSLAIQQDRIATRLRATRHLLILDNLESITGSNLAILHTLAPADQRALHGFLRDLAGGKTLVLLGSRGPEAWLAPGAFDANVYELPGLDAEAATTLADRILARHNATGYRDDPAMQQDLQRLITLLDGHPLALEVVLGNLAKQTPAEVLAALQSGDVGVDSAVSTEDKTKSILACINYSHSNLSPDAQQLLLCLAPFTGVINREWLPQYTEQLKAQPALAHLPFHCWNEVLAEAINWGLLTPDGELSNYLRVQPIFPYFLRTRLQTEKALHEQVNIAYRRHYIEIGQALARWIQSGDAQEKQVGQKLTTIEHENLMTAMQLLLANFEDFFNPFNALFMLLYSQQAAQQAIVLSDVVLTSAENYPMDKVANDISEHFFIVYGNKAALQLMLKQYDAARSTYEDTLKLIDRLTALSKEKRGKHQATAHYQLGMVAGEQRQWAQAEAYYQQALAIYIEFNDRHRQADTYHGLGQVERELRQWAQAEQHHQHALAIFIEFDDRYNQAKTLHTLGSVALGQRNYEQAQEYYQQALTLYIEFSDKFWQAGAYHQLGVVAGKQRQWAQAEQHFQQALATYIEFNDRYLQANAYLGLGQVAYAQQQWAQAEAYYQQALALYIEFNDRYRQADAYHNLGVVAQEQRQWAQAEAYYQQALALYIEFDERYDQANTYNQLGNAAYVQLHYEQAKAYYQQALSIYVELTDRFGQAAAYRNLGLIGEQKQQWTQAGEYFLHALQVYVHYSDQHNLHILLTDFARLHRASGVTALITAVAEVLGVATDDAAVLLAANLTER